MEGAELLELTLVTERVVDVPSPEPREVVVNVELKEVGCEVLTGATGIVKLT